MTHEAWLYVHRISGVGGQPVYGVKCQCGWESKRSNHPTRQAATDDWARHAEETK